MEGVNNISKPGQIIHLCETRLKAHKKGMMSIQYWNGIQWVECPFDVSIIDYRGKPYAIVESLASPKV